MASSPSPLQGKSLAAQQQSYPSGQVAVQLDDSGCGFCFYESGRVAACVNKVSDYQRSFQFYQDNTKKTLLATIDEHAVGSAGRPKGKKLLLTKDGGMILDADDKLTKSWRWDPKAQHAGTPPRDAVVIHLNDALVFTYTDRATITVKFAPGPGVSVVFDCGERLRRTDTYLTHAHRATEGPQRGKLLIDQEVPTLRERQKQIELDAVEKRSKQRPRSKDLVHDEIKSIVSHLETRFDAYEGCKVTPAADGNWKEIAMRSTLDEVPRLPRTGSEIGPEPTLFGLPIEVNDGASALQRLKNPVTGEWLGSVELHEKILHENPSLARKGPLTNASGRYSRELAVAGYVNGRKRPNTERLMLVSAAKLDRFLRDSCAIDDLVVVACLRDDDIQARNAEMILEQVQARLSAPSDDVSTSLAQSAIRDKCRLVKCDLAESSLLSDRYRIHAVPTFLIFYNSRLVHVSSLGGLPFRVFPATKNAHLSNQVDQLPRVLLVEKNVKQQVHIEKMLRKEEFQWDLALSGEQAVSFLTRLPIRSGASQNDPTPSLTLNASSSNAPAASSTGYGIVFLSDMLSDVEVRAVDRFLRPKERTKPSNYLVCGVIASPQCEIHFASSMCVECRKAQGRRISSASKASDSPLACPHCGIITTDAKTNVVSPGLAEAAHLLVYKHVKAATLHRLAELWLTMKTQQRTGGGVAGSEGNFTGLTVESFFREIEKHYSTAKRGVFLPDNVIRDMTLSVLDAIPTQPVTIINLLRSTSA